MSKIAIIKSFSCVCISTFALSSFSTAQVKQEKLIPATPKALSGQAKSVARIAGSDDEREILIKKRITDLHKKQAEFLKNLADGKTTTFPNVRKQLPEILSKIDSIKFAHKGIIEARSKDQSLLTDRESAKLAEVEKGIFTTLQAIGPFLSHADPRACDLTLTKTELSTLQALEKEDRSTSDDLKLSELHLLTGEHAYALHYIPVPISVKTTPGAPVYFEALNGGQFKQTKANTKGHHISLAKVFANEEGVAEIAWFTEGDAVGYMEVIITSPQASNFKILSVEVQKLMPKPLADLLAHRNAIPQDPTKLNSKEPLLPGTERSMKTLESLEKRKP